MNERKEKKRKKNENKRQKECHWKSQKPDTPIKIVGEKTEGMEKREKKGGKNKAKEISH